MPIRTPTSPSLPAEPSLGDRQRRLLRGEAPDLFEELLGGQIERFQALFRATQGHGTLARGDQGRGDAGCLALPESTDLQELRESMPPFPEDPCRVLPKPL